MELLHENLENAGGTVAPVILQGIDAEILEKIDAAAESAAKSDKLIDDALSACQVFSRENLDELKIQLAEQGYFPTNSKDEPLKARSLFAKDGAWRRADEPDPKTGRAVLIKYGKNNRELARADYNIALFLSRAEQRLFNRNRNEKDPNAPDWGKASIFDRLEAVSAMLVYVLPDDEQNKPTMEKGRAALSELLEHFTPKR